MSESAVVEFAVGQYTKAPVRAHYTDSGFDICADETVTILPRSRAVVHTGVRLRLPEGYECMVRPRSSMSRDGHRVEVGTIDCGYRGEVMVTVTNDTDCEYHIERYDRIAQLVVQRVEPVVFIRVENINADETSRGAGGFGSTGK